VFVKACCVQILHSNDAPRGCWIVLVDISNGNAGRGSPHDADLFRIAHVRPRPVEVVTQSTILQEKV
jgi:hypothetical protein